MRVLPVMIVWHFEFQSNGWMLSIIIIVAIITMFSIMIIFLKHSL